jgi:3-oxoacyl-[acyl-carrier protein] reductase
MSKSLENKVALVTGASKGIGAGIAVHLAEAGASVVVNYASDKDGAAKVVKTITSKGGKSVAVQADVGKVNEVDRLFSESHNAFGGKLDVLVNNAGIFFMTPLQEITEDVFSRMFATNVLSMLLCSKAAAKRFPQSGGSIINLSSVVAAKGFPGSAVYSATKGAIDSLTRVLSVELAPQKVRVNAVNPGLVITEGTQAAGFATGDFEAAWKSMAALGRAGTPDDIAPVVLFLASSASGWMTGENFYTTGGVR